MRRVLVRALGPASRARRRSRCGRRSGISGGLRSTGSLCKPSGPRLAAALVALVLGVPVQPIVADPAFVDVTVSSNLSFVGTYGGTFTGTDGGDVIQRNMGNGAAVADYDGDGDLDVYLLGSFGHANVLYRNNLDQGFKTFTDVTATAGVGETSFARVAHFADLDNDGDLDLLVISDNDGSNPSRVYRNGGDGTFSDVTAGSNFAPDGYLRAGCALADYDRDGLLDIYVTVWTRNLGVGNQGLFPGQNRLYRNLGGFVFEDVTESVGLGVLARDSYTAIFTDFSGNGYPDIYVAIDHAPDEFYLNMGGTFVPSAPTVGATHIGNDMGVACADFDDDGDLDLFATNITDPSGRFGTTQYNVFYINNYLSPSSFSFTDEATSRGVEDAYWGWGTDFIDVENDGDLDLVAVNGFQEFIELAIAGQKNPTHPLLDTPVVLFVNDSTGHFNRFLAPGLEATDDSRGLVVFDYDRDGDRDLLITNINEPARLLENVSDPRGNWLDVAVIQKDGQNRNGIGVRIYAGFNGVTKRRDIISGVSYLVGTPAEVHFGLGDATSVDGLRIEWTDGQVTIIHNVAANQRLVIEQPLEQVPTLGEVGVLIMAGLLLLAAGAVIKRRSIAHAGEGLA